MNMMMRKTDKKMRCPRCGSRLYFSRRNCKMKTPEHPKGIRPASLCMECGLVGKLYDLAPKPLLESAPVWNGQPLIEQDGEPIDPAVQRPEKVNL